MTNETVESQDKLTTAGGRHTDVVISAVDKCKELVRKTEHLERMLRLATDCLNDYADIYNWSDCAISIEDRIEIRESAYFCQDGHSRASRILIKIQNLDLKWRKINEQL